MATWPNAPMWATELKALGQLDGGRPCRLKRRRFAKIILAARQRAEHAFYGSMKLAFIARGDIALIISILTARRRAEHA
jgi:hypothetical protein